VFSLHQTSSISKCCTHTTILNHCLITLSNDLTERLQQKSQLQDHSVSATVTNNTKITTVYNNKHLDGGLRSHFFFFSPKKQTHTQIIQLSCSSQSQNIVQLEHHFSLNLFVAHNNVMWINDGSLAKQSYACAFAWSNESTFQKRGYIQYIFILRCSFHRTAKRLSITSLTHLLRLHTTIQSSIVRHIKYVTTWLQLYDM